MGLKVSLGVNCKTMIVLWFVLSQLLLLTRGLEVRVGDNNDPNSNEDVFVPTKEWQQVKPGQKIPKGLHVRMNMQTGGVDAKLLDDEESQRPSDLAVVDQPEKPEYNAEELKEILTNMKGNKDFTDNASSKQRSYEDLKKEFQALNMGAKSDSEIMTELYKEYIQTTDGKRKVDILTDFEYYVHQIDNGLNFVKMGGLNDIVIPGLNSSSKEIRSNSAYLLGSCAQGNPKVQISAYGAGLVEQLVKIIALDDSVEVKNKGLYALAVVCRQFPLAQNKLATTGALSSFSDILQQKDPKLAKIQLKIIALLYDLVLEPQLTKQQLNQNKNQSENAEELKEKLRQYELSNIKENLLKNNWCQTVNDFLVRIYETSVSSDETDHDTVEKILYFMSLLSDECQPSFVRSRLIFESFQSKYNSLVEVDGDEYFAKLANLCSMLLLQLKTKDEIMHLDF